MSLKLALAALLLVPALAWAQQPTAADLQSAYEMATQQRNEAQDKYIQLGVAVKRLQEQYEARLATAMEWLKTAQGSGK